MAHDEHSLLRENIPAYALGALDAEDIRALEAHLQTCEACRAELASYRAISENLLMTVPPRQPSPALRKRLQSRLPSAQSVQKTARPRFAWSFGQLALGSALVLLVAINLVSFMQLRDFQRQSQNSQAVLAMLAYPGTQALPISGGDVSGTVLLDRDRNSAAVIAWNLPKISSAQTYQIWWIEPDGHRVSAGVFRPQADLPYTTQPCFSSQSVSNFVGLGVTLEPAGGSAQPTGPRVFKVDF
ncbi:MAG TPA: anti-sigma factor [Anaerolineales bacterium]|nr:anti-sigma factor [Anaerolineales bacterium]